MRPHLDRRTRGGIQVNGAHSLLNTLMANGVDVCFANPGTSEMHFVAALDQLDGMRCVLGLFEGVVTGAADGTGGWPTDRRRRCSTWGRAWLTGSRTCTTRCALGRQS